MTASHRANDGSATAVRLGLDHVQLISRHVVDHQHSLTSAWRRRRTRGRWFLRGRATRHTHRYPHKVRTSPNAIAHRFFALLDHASVRIVTGIGYLGTACATVALRTPAESDGPLSSAEDGCGGGVRTAKDSLVSACRETSAVRSRALPTTPGFCHRSIMPPRSASRRASGAGAPEPTAPEAMRVEGGELIALEL